MQSTQYKQKYKNTLQLSNTFNNKTYLKDPPIPIGFIKMQLSQCKHIEKYLLQSGKGGIKNMKLLIYQKQIGQNGWLHHKLVYELSNTKHKTVIVHQSSDHQLKVNLVAVEMVR